MIQKNETYAIQENKLIIKQINNKWTCNCI